jgi:anti-sigma factor RsiW
MNEKNAFTDADLLMFIDGELSAQAAEVIRHSPEAMARVAALSATEGRLRAVLRGADRPDSLVLGEYLLGMLDREEMAVIARYLAENPAVQAELDQMDAFMAAVGLQPEPQPALARAASQIRRLVARLIDEFASGPGAGTQLAMAGMRGREGGPLQFEVADYQISIDTRDDSAQPGARVILGLLLGNESAGWQVQLRRAEQLLQTEAVDELGNFTLTGVSPGQYSLNISDGQTEVQIEELNVA